jgi:hypothetical protein
VVDARAGGEEPQLEHAVLGDQRLVPGDALAGEDGVSAGQGRGAAENAPPNTG